MLEGSSSLQAPLTGEENGTGNMASSFSAGALLHKVQNSVVGSTYSGLRQRMRPWVTDFAAVNRFSRPGDSWAARVRTNLTYYKANYTSVFGGVLVVSIVTSPMLLIAIAIFGGLWVWLLSVRPRLEDGSIAPVTIGGRTLSGFEQKAGLGGVTLLAMLFTSIGSTIFWALGVAAVLIGVHSALHTTEFHEVGAEEFGTSSEDRGGFSA